MSHTHSPKTVPVKTGPVRSRLSVEKEKCTPSPPPPFTPSHWNLYMEQQSKWLFMLHAFIMLAKPTQTKLSCSMNNMQLGLLFNFFNLSNRSLAWKKVIETDITDITFKCLSGQLISVMKDGNFFLHKCW